MSNKLDDLKPDLVRILRNAVKSNYQMQKQAAHDIGWTDSRLSAFMKNSPDKFSAQYLINALIDINIEFTISNKNNKLKIEVDNE